MNLSAHVTLAEVTKNNTASKYGIDNTPTPEHTENLKLVLNNIFEKVRAGLGNNPIYISCGYRSAVVNAKTKGASKTSQHCFGEALDLDADVFGKITNKQIFDYVRKNLPYDQIIWEYGTTSQPDWVHVSLKKASNRKMDLRAITENGKPKYIPFDLY